MSRIRRLLIGLAILFSVATSAVVHAREQICVPESEASGIYCHEDGKGEMTPVDPEKGFPHHHACNGHHIAASSDRSAQIAPRAGKGARIIGVKIAIAEAPIDPALRPPIA